MSEAPKEAAGKKNTGKLMLIIGIVVLLLGGGGGAAWFMLKGKPHDAAADAEAAYKEALKHRVYVPLDTFTVNLADDKDQRMAQVGMVLEVRDGETGEEIKAIMPTVRNKILMLLSAKQSKDLLTVDGKEQLAQQVAEATAGLIGHAPKRKKPKRKIEKADDDADGAKKDEADGEDADAEAPKVVARPEIPLIRVNFSQFIVQ